MSRMTNQGYNNMLSSYFMNQNNKFYIQAGLGSPSVNGLGSPFGSRVEATKQHDTITMIISLRGSVKSTSSSIRFTEIAVFDSPTGGNCIFAGNMDRKTENGDVIPLEVQITRP